MAKPFLLRKYIFILRLLANISKKRRNLLQSINKKIDFPTVSSFQGYIFRQLDQSGVREKSRQVIYRFEISFLINHSRLTDDIIILTS